MKKIPTLFVRDENDRRYVTREVTPGCEWVLAGEGKSTRKFDGTCVCWDGERWWARREVKQGKQAPEGFSPISTDDVTGKTVGWEPAEQSAFAKYLIEATEGFRFPADGWTYELCGPKVNGNPERFEKHVVVPHGNYHIGPSLRTYDSIRDFLLACVPPIEGLVYHHDDGRMAKIKTRDFPAGSA